jgi:hypothetical protein
MKKFNKIFALVIAMSMMLVFVPQDTVQKTVSAEDFGQVEVITEDPASLNWSGANVKYIDFSEVDSISLSDGAVGEGLTLLPNGSATSWKSANRLENGYLLLGKQANTDGGNPETLNVGNIYIKINSSTAEKANTPYAVKIDYYGGGESGDNIDSGSYIDLAYNNASNSQATSRITYGATYNTGNVETKYFALTNSNLNENIGTQKADLRFSTWNNAKLRIRRISVVEFEPLNIPEMHTGAAQADKVYVNFNTGEYNGITPASAEKVKVVDDEGITHYAAKGVNYFGFRITDATVRGAANATIKISYWDIGLRSFSVEYNSVIPDPLPDGQSENTYNYYSTNSVPMSDNQKLYTVEIPLKNTAFNGRQNGGNDFRINSLYMPGFYIEEVTVSIGCEMDATLREPIEFPQTTAKNNFRDKTIVGYQAWFKTDKSLTVGWDHWNTGSAPSSGNQRFDVYPDISDYPDSILYQTGYSNCLDGSPAVLYDGTSQEAIDIQVKWLRDYGIDGFAVSRFYAGACNIELPGRNKLDYMKEAAEKYNRIFYMGYDISGIGAGGAASIKRLEEDFVLNVEKKFVTSPNYAQVDGRPVVSLWGFQGSQFNRYPNAENALSLITWFQERGYYVIGGVPDNNWANDTSDYKAVYEAIDMITPWTVGRFNNSNATAYLTGKYVQDRAWLDAYNEAHPSNQKDYLPTISPGFSWANWATSGRPNSTPRNAGAFIWEQARLAKYYGFSSSFIAMFDEYDEGTAIAKQAEDSFVIPSDQYFVTTSADGWWLSSDFYLRTVGNAVKMLKGTTPLTDTNPTIYSEGPLLYRNGFESRYVNCNEERYRGIYPIDPCFKNEAEVTATNVSNDSVTIVDEKAKTGSYSAKITGTATSDSGVYDYKFSESNVEIQNGTTISFDKYTSTEQGKYITVDIVCTDGTRASVSTLNAAATQPKGTVGSWTNHEIVIGKGDMLGKTVSTINFKYQGNAAGEFTAFFDNIVIENGEPIVIGTNDLHTTAVQTSIASPNDGDELTFYCVLRNEGTQDTDSPIKVDYYMDNRFLESVTYSESIPAGGMKLIATKTPKSVFFGTHTVRVIVNNDNSLTETDYTNNNLKQKVKVNS